MQNFTAVFLEFAGNVRRVLSVEGEAAKGMRGGSYGRYVRRAQRVLKRRRRCLLTSHGWGCMRLRKREGCPLVLLNQLSCASQAIDR